MPLAMDLAKVVLGAEPTLLDNDIGASARVSAALADVLGSVMATVLVEEPGNYHEALGAIMTRVHEGAVATMAKAMSLAANSPPERAN